MGCSSAYFLAQRIPPSSICILERDPTVCMHALYRTPSLALSLALVLLYS